MCLTLLADFEISKNYGWQIFRMVEEGLSYLYFDKPFVPVLEGRWQTDPNDYYLETEYNGEQYSTGFHLFVYKKDALVYRDLNRDEVVRKVWFNNIVARGIQRLFTAPPSTAKVVVVRERFVEKA